MKQSLARRKSDKEFSRQIRARGACEVCGTTRNLQCHHVVSRRVGILRHDKRNGVCLCPKCHTFGLDMSAHQTPLKFAEWFKKKRRKDYNYILKEQWSGKKPNYEEVLKKLEAEHDNG